MVIRRLTAIFAVALLLGGCGVPAMLGTGPNAYDGVWSGRATFALGVADCPRLAGLQAEIRNGVIDGNARWGEERGTFRGVIREDGALRSASVRRGQAAFADFEGSFEENAASGRWTSRHCEGDWELRKVRGL